MIICLMDIAIRIVKYILYHHTHHHISPYILIIEPCIQACLLNNFIESRPTPHYHICRIALSYIALYILCNCTFCIMEVNAIDHNNTNVFTFTFIHMHIFRNSCSYLCTFFHIHILPTTTVYIFAYLSAGQLFTFVYIFTSTHFSP